MATTTSPPAAHSRLSAAARERAQLCSLLLKVGESAPTLCSPWDTGDLAAHLLVRETRVDALPGLMVPALAGHTASLQARVRAAQPFAAMVEQLRSGPSWKTPLGLPGVRDRANLHEFFIHHEDVLRAEPGWRVRELPAEESAQLWNAARQLAPWMLRGIKDTRVTLQTPEGAERSVGRAESEHRVTVLGAPSELLLYLSGRRTVAQVRISGSPAGQARLAAAKHTM
jgi:uncharacterized protein (TIGR03085 family)